MLKELEIKRLKSENEMLKKQVQILKDANKKYTSLVTDYQSIIDRLHDEEKQCKEMLDYLTMVKADVDEIIKKG